MHMVAKESPLQTESWKVCGKNVMGEQMGEANWQETSE
jgi:hypothetical protein